MAAIYQETAERTVLRNVGWDTYIGLLRDHEQSSTPRFTYDRGTLEIMSPLPEHERYAQLIELLVAVSAEELGIEVYSLGSTTFRREDLLRGFEPDACFYIQHEADIRGKGRLDLHVDPPPDLVFEVDITHSSLDKLEIYAPLRVPELWRFNGSRFAIMARADEGYVERSRSHVLPAMTSAALASLLRENSGMSNVAWMRHVRAWIRTVRR